MTRVFAAVLTMALVLGIPARGFAQNRTDFSGTWTFRDDASEVRIVAGGALAASKLVITQTPVELRIESSALLQTPGVAVYRLDGTESSFTSAGSTTRAKTIWQGQNLVITGTRSYPAPQGGMFSVEVKEVYSLSGDRLTVERTETLQGVGNTDKMVFVKGSIPRAFPATVPPVRREAGAVPRMPDGRPNLSGYWTGNSRGGLFDIEPHAGSFAVGGGAGIVVDPADGKIPYQEWAVKERDRRAVAGIALLEDPEPHCFLSGVPRQWYIMPYQIIQTPKELIGLHEYVHARRIIPITNTGHAAKGLRLWQGDSRARWEGDTLVVDVTNFNGKTWFDMAGNFYSENAHIVERYTMTDANTIRYEATIEDPTVYTKPFKVVFNIERVNDQGFEVLESACHEEDQDLRNVRSATQAGANKEVGAKE